MQIESTLFLRPFGERGHPQIITFATVVSRDDSAVAEAFTTVLSAFFGGRILPVKFH